MYLEGLKFGSMEGGVEIRHVTECRRPLCAAVLSNDRQTPSSKDHSASHRQRG